MLSIKKSIYLAKIPSSS